jgi:hypothetical protein
MRRDLDRCEAGLSWELCPLFEVSRAGTVLESPMTEMVPRNAKSDPVPRRMVLAIAVACALLAPSPGSAYDGPTLRRGLWQFERTLETDGKPTDRLQTNGLPIDRQVTRCVDPTEALKAEFTPLKVGACDIKDLQKTDDGYVFQRICRGLTPIKTAINIKGAAPIPRPTRVILESYRPRKSW